MHIENMQFVASLLHLSVWEYITGVVGRGKWRHAPRRPKPSGPTNVGRPLWWWWPCVLSTSWVILHVSDTVLFIHQWHTFYSDCLLICIISKWL